MDLPKLYRKRFIPNEIILLKDDKILEYDDNVLVTKWKTLRPRKDFAMGYSCYFLKKGYKISKFLDKNEKLVYYYCDIIDTIYNDKENSYLFVDLLADVIIYPNGSVKVVDIGEIADAMEKGLISSQEAQKALHRLQSLLNLVYSGKLKESINNYF